MKLAPSWTLYYWISLYVVWESQRRTIQTSCSYWLQFDSLFTRLLLRLCSSLPQGQNRLYCSADCCLQMAMEQVRSSCSRGAVSQMWPPREDFDSILLRHILFHQWAALLASKGHGKFLPVTVTGKNFTCTSRVVPLVDLFNFDLHEWFLESVDTEFC